MSLASKRGVQNLLKKYQVRPSKRLGQNFLIDKGVIKKLIGAANLRPKNIILEIGPGIGTLTIELAKKVKKVIAIEKDQKMVEILKETLENFKNVKIIKGDTLKFRILDFGFPGRDGFPSNYKVVGNLPFYLTAPVIRKFLELPEARPRAMVLVVQKEVGQRICARTPGQRDKSLLHPSLRLGNMSILAVSVQFYAKPEIISYISKKSFWPQPKVDGAILKIIPKKPTTSPGLVDLFFKIVKAGFSHPRKQLINNLSKGFLPALPTGQAGGRQGKFNRGEVKDWLLKNNIQPNQRAETLTVENWISLTKNFNFMVK